MDTRSGSAGDDLEIIRSDFAALSALVVAQLDRALAAWQEGWDVTGKLAATDRLDVTIHGRSAHGAAPHAGIDPIVAAGHVVVALQSIVARRLDPIDAGVVTVASIHAGTAYNIIPPDVTLTQGLPRTNPS